MRKEIRFGPAEKDELALLGELGSNLLRSLAEDLEGQEIGLARSDIESVINRHVPGAKGELLSRFLFWAATLVRHAFSSASELLDAMQTAIDESPSDNRLVDWPAVRPAVERLLSLKSVRFAAKAIDISYDFERIYISGRFLTSIRPVFADDKGEIVGAAVVQTLRLEFALADGNSKSLSIALDRADIQQLMKRCEEALTKGETTAREARLSWNKRTIMAGENDQ